VLFLLIFKSLGYPKNASNPAKSCGVSRALRDYIIGVLDVTDERHEPRKVLQGERPIAD